MGYNVFWADKSIEGGNEYEPTIFNALYTAKFMIILATEADYLNGKWVINEWGRFLRRKADGEPVNFCVVHGNSVEPYSLPRALQKAQALNHSKPRYFEQLVNAVEKAMQHYKEACIAGYVPPHLQIYNDEVELPPEEPPMPKALEIPLEIPQKIEIPPPKPQASPPLFQPQTQTQSIAPVSKKSVVV
jgi:hypothetical protein